MENPGQIYTVLSLVSILESDPLPEVPSTQHSELTALTKACQLAKGTIYTSSRHTFDMAHAFGIP